MKSVNICFFFYFVLPFVIVIAKPFPQQLYQDTKLLLDDDTNPESLPTNDGESDDPAQARTVSVLPGSTQNEVAFSNTNWVTATNNISPNLNIDSSRGENNLPALGSGSTSEEFSADCGDFAMPLCCNDGKSEATPVRVNCASCAFFCPY